MYGRRTFACAGIGFCLSDARRYLGSVFRGGVSPARRRKALLKLEGMDVPERVRRFTGVDVYADREASCAHEGEPLSWQWFVGFEVYDVEQGFLGSVERVDDATANVLFVVVDEEGEELLIPACEEFIVGIDRKGRVLDVELPEGLID